MIITSNHFFIDGLIQMYILFLVYSNICGKNDNYIIYLIIYQNVYQEEPVY